MCNRLNQNPAEGRQLASASVRGHSELRAKLAQLVACRGLTQNTSVGVVRISFGRARTGPVDPRSIREFRKKERAGMRDNRAGRLRYPSTRDSNHLGAESGHTLFSATLKVTHKTCPLGPERNNDGLSQRVPACAKRCQTPAIVGEKLRKQGLESAS